MNSSGNVTYSQSELHANIGNAETLFFNAFGSSYIPKHRGMFSSNNNYGNVSNWTWRDMRVELMSEEQVYGHSVWGSANHNGYDVGTQKTQFRLFSLDQSKINIRQKYWLSNVKSTEEFARVLDYGTASFGSCDDSIGVRPFACVVGDPEE
jgi:hypothetical protein